MSVSTATGLPLSLCLWKYSQMLRVTRLAYHRSPTDLNEYILCNLQNCNLITRTRTMVYTYTVQTPSFFIGALPQADKEWDKWKNHFFKMKGDVKM